VLPAHQPKVSWIGTGAPGPFPDVVNSGEYVRWKTKSGLRAVKLSVLPDRIELSTSPFITLTLSGFIAGAVAMCTIGTQAQASFWIAKQVNAFL